MPTSTITSKGQTTVPKEVREALDLEPNDKLTWEVNGGRVAVTTERPALYQFEGFIRHGEAKTRRSMPRFCDLAHALARELREKKRPRLSST